VSTTISAKLVKELREKTGAGMMDCKRALEASGGDLDAAIEHLRKKGAAVGQKRADRTAKEGIVVTHVSQDSKRGVIVEINCETDFVGRSPEFGAFADAVAEAVERHKPATIDAVAGLTAPNGKKISEMLNDLLSKVAEKIEIRRFSTYESSDGLVSSYTHLGSKIGVLVELTGLHPSDDASRLGRDVAMQIAAMNPMVIAREQVDKSLVDREMDVYRTQAKNEGKPAQIIERIATGRLEKFFQEVCLLEQTFIKDSGKTVKDFLQDAGKNVTVKRFQRFHLGEETK
jgi:elongation factor Ts